MTTKELRALLADSTPAPWSEEPIGYDDARAIDQNLITAMHAALPALLDVVEKVASAEADLVTYWPGGSSFGCVLCGGKPPYSQRHDLTKAVHAPDCAWVAARKLCGEA